MKRLFIAVKLNLAKNIINDFSEIKNIFSTERIKWVNFNQLHITLKFLGDTEPELIPEIKSILTKVANNFSGLTLHLKGVGVFKNFKNPRVLWVGIEKNIILKNLQREIDKNLSLIGIPSENREFNPHLTLGRIKYINNKKKFIDFILKNSNRSFTEININEFYLIESILRKEGPIYIDLERFPLHL